MSISATRELLHLIGSEEFVNEYGELFLILNKINQDFVESFFSCQRQMCGGTQNMTAFVYGYNVNGYTTFQATKALTNKQTNAYELQEALSYFNGEQEPDPLIRGFATHFFSRSQPKCIINNQDC